MKKKFSVILRFARKMLKPGPTVAVIKLNGIIGNAGLGKQGIMADSMADKIEQAFSIKNLKAVALQINSPGGSPVQSELIFKRIKYFANKHNIPVLSFIEDCAASGGYWLACAGEKIYAADNSIVGSIGVISSGFGFDKTINKLGIDRRIYTQGDSKSILDPFSPEKEEDIKIIKEMQKDIYENFKNLVLANRSVINKKQEKEIFSGAIWSSKKAKELGLIDDFGDMYSVIYEQYGDKITIKKINTEKSWLKSKLGIVAEIFVDSFVKAIESRISNARINSIS